jgi:hypothetical protein
LADFVVEALRAELADEDVIGMPQEIGVFLLYRAEDAHAQTGAGEWVPIDDRARQTELGADLSDLVLEQVAQRLDSFKCMRSGKPPTL